jgi:hypothetical protein
MIKQSIMKFGVEIYRHLPFSIRDKLVKIGAKLVTHARYAIFQMAEVAVPRDLFRRILANIADLRCRAPTQC